MSNEHCSSIQWRDSPVLKIRTYLTSCLTYTLPHTHARLSAYTINRVERMLWRHYFRIIIIIFTLLTRCCHFFFIRVLLAQTSEILSRTLLIVPNCSIKCNNELTLGNYLRFIRVSATATPCNPMLMKTGDNDSLYKSINWKERFHDNRLSKYKITCSCHCTFAIKLSNDNKMFQFHFLVNSATHRTRWWHSNIYREFGWKIECRKQ